MKKTRPFIIVMLLTFFGISYAAFSQQYATGGYQGGNHGNVKEITWSGAVSDDWSDPDNWCPKVVPDETKMVVIPSVASVMPEVKSDGLSCKSLKLEPGAAVTIKTGYQLIVNGEIVE